MGRYTECRALPDGTGPSGLVEEAFSTVVPSTFQNAQSLKGLHPKMLKAPHLPNVDNGFASR